MITRNFKKDFASPIFGEKKYVVRTCHLKDFEIYRQDNEKRCRKGRSFWRSKMIKMSIFFFSKNDELLIILWPAGLKRLIWMASGP